jgi:hypothetical protein
MFSRAFALEAIWEEWKLQLCNWAESEQRLFDPRRVFKFLLAVTEG